ncbi:MAG TPA: DUF1287 domain-containing protein [Rhizomicrobium sp.]|nr:DUF1287 domain-containing protein [Rhizomicrobium sp.]
MTAWLLALQLLAALPAPAAPVKTAAFLRAASALIDPRVRFAPGYRRIPYPMGDVPADQGVCADVVVRAYRGVGIDLQKLLHEDMTAHFALYPGTWRLAAPDPNIDQRRVLNLGVFFTRFGKVLKITNDPGDYRPGDLVTWNLDPRGSTPHIGIVMPTRSPDGKRPLILNNIGRGQVLEDILFAFRITGHYRYGIDRP